jgi:hypothetical protein
MAGIRDENKVSGGVGSDYVAQFKPGEVQKENNEGVVNCAIEK